jgi:2-dehydro-3-deoxyphosphogluconate aldolase/(4S)-4-hydroxy-2-oxoglutarate aldolase
VATISEAMTAAERGFDTLKLFPAAPMNALRLLPAWAGPLPALRFCPTGGVRAEELDAYLALPNVICVGGSWVATPALIADRRWSEIRTRAAAAAASARPAQG